MGILSVIGCATAACSLSPMPNCKEGTVICESSNDGNGGALFRCIDDEKVYERNCMLGCNGDACATNDACTVGSTQCVDEHKIKQCGPNGWEFFECNGTCANGQCTIKDCNDTESTCEDGFTAKHCQNGKSLLEECPTGQKCDNGACVAIPTPVPANQEICDDNIDNDNNGKTDCEDEICKMHTHCSTIKPSNEICDNHIDDDGNGKADCQDEACSTHSNCSTTSSDNEICDNHIDDDGNGRVDCEDEACKSQEHCSTSIPVQEICNNNIDDDGNGKADCQDEACSTHSSCSTTIPVQEICDNNIDDDGNGKADCQDEACKSQEHCSTATPVQEICDNHIDDNGDGIVDCDDEACKDKEECKTTTTVCNAECTHCKMDGSVFYICSAKGIPEYQKLSDEERAKYNRLVFVGNINLADLNKSTSSSECAFDSWTPLAIPVGMTITGENANITNINSKNTRCTLPASLFDKVENGAITNLNLDYDFLGEGSGILVDTLINSTIEDLTYSGSANQTMNSSYSGKWGFSLIPNAKDFKIINTSFIFDTMFGYGQAMGGVISSANNGSFKDVNVSYKLLRNYGNNGGLSALMSSASGTITIDRVSIIAQKVLLFAFREFFGGIAETVSNSSIEIKDIYIQFKSLEQTSGNDNLYSGGFFGSINDDKSNITVSKAVIILSKFSGLGISLAGLIGHSDSPNISIRDSIIISDDPLYGIFGSLTSNPKLNNIITVSPTNKCENILTDKTSTNDFTLVCSPENNVFYYTADVCDSNRCGEPLLNNEKDILNRLQDSSNFEWTMQTVHVGGKEIKAPVFDTLGPLP